MAPEKAAKETVTSDEQKELGELEQGKAQRMDASHRCSRSTDARGRAPSSSQQRRSQETDGALCLTEMVERSDCGVSEEAFMILLFDDSSPQGVEGVAEYRAQFNEAP